jgi:flagellar export protein FliJ
MKKFSFRLEKVLKYRKHLEDKARIGLFEALGERRSKEEAVGRIEMMRRKLYERCGSEKQKEMEVFRYRLYQDYFGRLNDDRKKAELELARAEISVGQKRAALKSESVRKKALERFKEIQSARHKEFVLKEEQKDLDETAVTGKGEVG